MEQIKPHGYYKQNARNSAHISYHEITVATKKYCKESQECQPVKLSGRFRKHYNKKKRIEKNSCFAKYDWNLVDDNLILKPLHHHNHKVQSLSPQNLGVTLHYLN